MAIVDYARALQSLLPQGLAWCRSLNGVLGRLLTAWASECQRVDDKGLELLDAVFPDSANTALLSDWQRVTQTTSRAAMLAQLRATGGQSIAYFIQIAAAWGYAITINEFPPFTAISACNQAINGNVPNFNAQSACTDALVGFNWRFVWRVVMPAGVAIDADFEQFIRQVSPAHTFVIFHYS